MRGYPAKGEERPIRENTGSRWIVCGRQARVRQFIEVSWFRGDDECAKVCKKHSRLPAQVLFDALLKELEKS